MKEETIVDIYDQATRLIEDLRVLCDIIDSAEPALPVESQYNPVPFPVTKYDGETMRNISAGEHLSTELAGARTGECAPMSDTDRGLIRSAGSTNPAPAAPSTAAQEAAGTTERSPALPVDIVAKNARGYCIDRHGRECSNSQCYERGCERDRTSLPVVPSTLIMCVNRSGCETPNECQQHRYCQSPHAKLSVNYPPMWPVGSESTAKWLAGQIRTAAPTISLEAWLVALCKERLTNDVLATILERAPEWAMTQHCRDVRTGITVALTGRGK